MNSNKRRLGRGLDALLGRENGGFEASTLDMAELLHLPVDQIDPNPFQPRRVFDAAEIAALADSLRQHGMLQPVIVRQVNDRYQLIAGERRLRASIEAQLHEIPARVFDLDDQRVAELAMVENLQREDLNAIEKAVAFRDYLNKYGGTQEELANRLGLDRSTVSNLIRLLDLPEEVRQAVLDKKITQGHARALLGLPDPSTIVGACEAGDLGGTSPSARSRPWSPPASRRRPGPASARTRPSPSRPPRAGRPRMSWSSNSSSAGGSAPP